MKKPKKITVKFFLNTHLAPISQNKNLAYPIYMQVTYNRKNTQIKSLYAGFHSTLEEFKQKERAIFFLEERIMQKAVAYELEKNETDFKLKGLGDKYELYALSTHFIVSAYLKAKLHNLLPLLRPIKYVELIRFDKAHTDFTTLYNLCLRLFDNTAQLLDPLFKEEIQLYEAYYQAYASTLNEGNYNFPVVIDWLEGSHLQELEAKLLPFLHNDLNVLKKAILFINKTISTKLALR